MAQPDSTLQTLADELARLQAESAALDPAARERGQLLELAAAHAERFLAGVAEEAAFREPRPLREAIQQGPSLGQREGPQQQSHRDQEP